MSDLKAGDVVKLKSGRVPMTISVITDSGGIRTHWFEGFVLRDGSFKPQELEICTVLTDGTIAV